VILRSIITEVEECGAQASVLSVGESTAEILTEFTPESDIDIMI